jgi:hypothetical protein
LERRGSKELGLSISREGGGGGGEGGGGVVVDACRGCLLSLGQGPGGGRGTPLIYTSIRGHRLWPVILSRCGIGSSLSRYTDMRGMVFDGVQVSISEFNGKKVYIVVRGFLF